MTFFFLSGKLFKRMTGGKPRCDCPCRNYWVTKCALTRVREDCRYCSIKKVRENENSDRREIGRPLWLPPQPPVIVKNRSSYFPYFVIWSTVSDTPCHKSSKTNFSFPHQDQARLRFLPQGVHPDSCDRAHEGQGHRVPEVPEVLRRRAGRHSSQVRSST